MPLQTSAQPRGLRNLSIGLIVLLMLSIALWLVFAKIEIPTKNDRPTKTAGNASESAKKSIQSDTQSVAPAQKSTQSDIRSEQKSTQSDAQTAQTNTERPAQSMKNDVETKMCEVADRNFYHLSGAAVSREQNGVPDSAQAPVDDKLTAEEVVAAGEKDPSVAFKSDLPISGIRFYDGLYYTYEPRQPVIDAQKLSQNERVRLCGLRQIQRMAALILYNNRCGDRPRDDNAAAASAIIENQFRKFPRDVQEKTFDYQVKAIEVNPGGWKWFCERVDNEIKKGYADSMFETAREGFFPIEGN